MAFGFQKMHKSAQKVIQERSSSKKVPEHAPRGSRKPQKRPKRDPGEAKRGPKGPRWCQKDCQERPQECPKSTRNSQVRAKMAPMTHSEAENHRNRMKQSKRNNKHAKLPPEIFPNRNPKGLQNWSTSPRIWQAPDPVLESMSAVTEILWLKQFWLSA